MIEPAQIPSGPTGRRRLTAGQVRALEYAPPRRGGPSRGQVFSAFKRAARLLGVSRSVILLIDLLASLTHEEDWEGAGPRPIVWPSNRWIGERLELGRTQVKCLLSEAFDLELIAMRESGTGRRVGKRQRGAEGPILWAYGIDLSPLAARHAEFLALVDAEDRRDAEAKELRAVVSALRRAVLTLADRGTALEPHVATWRDIAIRARQLGDNRGWERDPDVLRLTEAALRTLKGSAEAHLAAAESAPAAGDNPLKAGETPVETDPSGPVFRPLTTTTTKPSTSSDTAANAGDRPAAERVQSGAAERRGESTAARPDWRDGVLRGFPATPTLVLAISPPFRDCVPTARPNEAQIVEAARDLRHRLGINLHAWIEAQQAWGAWPAAVALAAIAARHAAGAVRSPGGLLRKMLELHAAGTLRLDRTLWGLVDGQLQRGATGDGGELANLRSGRGAAAGRDRMASA